MDDIAVQHNASAAAMSSAASQATHFVVQNLSSVDTISRSTSPGVPILTPDEDDKKRYRPRTFAYFSQLPFAVEEDHERDEALQGILKNLYIAVKAEDFAPGAMHWTRELQGWLNLKFEMVRELRATLAHLYYHLALAPGLDSNTADRFTKMVITLTKYAPRCPPPFLSTMF
jgi:proteasome activator subunit 4